MTTKMRVGLVACMLLFIVIEEAKPVLAKKNRIKARISKLEKGIEDMAKCSPCQKIKEILEKLDKFKEILKSLKEEETKPGGGAFGGGSSILGSLDKKYTDQLMTFLEPVLQSPNSKLVRCWSGATDGWAAATFHEKCNEKGPTVTLIQSGDYVFGGYTNEPWKGNLGTRNPCYYAEASKVFIFSLYNKNGYEPLKLFPKETKKDYAMFNCNHYGPTFGSAPDLYVADHAGDNENSYTNCDYAFEAPPGYSMADQSKRPEPCDYFTGSYAFTPSDVEVFYEEA